MMLSYLFLHHHCLTVNVLLLVVLTTPPHLTPTGGKSNFRHSNHQSSQSLTLNFKPNFRTAIIYSFQSDLPFTPAQHNIHFSEGKESLDFALPQRSLSIVSYWLSSDYSPFEEAAYGRQTSKAPLLRCDKSCKAKPDSTRKKRTDGQIPLM